ncbi:MAG TPA: hypothetical protein VER38_02430 [Candidatus Eisenbacteria bacterium]|nr:hypothetical protein [Candidatus Eisenbacteria bacterium]
MNKNRSIRLTALALVLAWTVPMSPTTGIARAEKKPEAKPEVKLDAPSSAKTLRVAVLPVINTSGEADALKIMEDVLNERFKDVDRAKAIFLMPGDVERVLSDAGRLDRTLRLADRWSKTGAVDSTAVVGLDSALVADAVLLIKVSEWETKRFHNIGEGQSNTTIGLHFALFNLKNGRKMWGKDVREQRFAQEIDASSGMVGYDATGRIQTANATDPPRVGDVASDLVRDALKKFPIK